MHPKSSVIAPQTFLPKAKFSTIDVHIHNYPEQTEGISPKEALAEWVNIQEEVGIETSVLLTGATGEEFDRLVEMYLTPYPGRFQTAVSPETTDICRAPAHQLD